MSTITLSSFEAESLLAGTPEERKLAAYELVDWLRFHAQPLDVDQFNILVGLTERLYPPACRLLYEYLDPSQPLLWTYIKTTVNSTGVYERCILHQLLHPTANLLQYSASIYYSYIVMTEFWTAKTHETGLWTRYILQPVQA